MKNDIMVSLDVESLFTNIPVKEAIELSISIIMKRKRKDENYKKLATRDLINLLELVVTHTPLRLYDQLYVQRDGVSMGSPLVFILAYIFMTHVEQRLRDYQEFDRIKMCLRYVQGTFIICNRNESDADLLVQFVNTPHPKTNFTREIKKNYERPFLDVRVLKYRDKFEKGMYKKEIHTDQLPH